MGPFDKNARLAVLALTYFQRRTFGWNCEGTQVRIRKDGWRRGMGPRVWGGGIPLHREEVWEGLE